MLSQASVNQDAGRAVVDIFVNIDYCLPQCYEHVHLVWPWHVFSKKENL